MVVAYSGYQGDYLLRSTQYSSQYIDGGISSLFS